MYGYQQNHAVLPQPLPTY